MRVASLPGMKSESYEDLLRRLSKRSVDKHFDAYGDVDWDAPEHRIEKADPRFELDEDHVLGATAWYRRLPPSERAALGLELVAQQMKVGIAFENILSRGLLHFAMAQPDRSPAYRYAYHEVIEESQHSLMFQEFINRSGVTPPGLRGIRALGANFVPRLGRTFPEMFFLFVLGGEGPIDQVQREQIEKGRPLHPILERIIRIHVMEEARHICFAKRYLQEHVPALSAAGMWHLRIRMPIVFSQMAKSMLEPPRVVLRRFRVPARVVREAYRDNPAHRRSILAGLASVRELCRELQIVTPGTVWIWQRLGIWPDEPLQLPA